jgi:hypothetical protein
MTRQRSPGASRLAFGVWRSAFVLVLVLVLDKGGYTNRRSKPRDLREEQFFRTSKRWMEKRPIEDEDDDENEDEAPCRRRPVTLRVVAITRTVTNTESWGATTTDNRR